MDEFLGLTIREYFISLKKLNLIYENKPKQVSAVLVSKNSKYAYEIAVNGILQYSKSDEEFAKLKKEFESITNHIADMATMQS